MSTHNYNNYIRSYKQGIVEKKNGGALQCLNDEHTSLPIPVASYVSIDS